MGDEGSRRTFLKTIVALGGLAAAALAGVPGIAALLDPLLRPRRSPSERRVVGPASVLRDDRPVALRVIGDRTDAWTRAPRSTLGTVWLQKGPDGAVTCHSGECPHLGCQIGFDARKHLFVCPCHASEFALDGSVRSGPSARPMDTLEAEITGDGDIAVRFTRFRPQTDRKEEV
jgi:Rieske Fe-S protein